MNVQFKKGVLDLILLHLIEEKPRSAYDLIILLSEGLHVNENTIYPLLRRLEKEAYLSHKKAYGEMGAPKKIFLLTEKGKEHYLKLYHDWHSFQKEVSILLGGNKNDT